MKLYEIFESFPVNNRNLPFPGDLVDWSSLNYKQRTEQLRFIFPDWLHADSFLIHVSSTWSSVTVPQGMHYHITMRFRNSSFHLSFFNNRHCHKAALQNSRYGFWSLMRCDSGKEKIPWNDIKKNPWQIPDSIGNPSSFRWYHIVGLYKSFVKQMHLVRW